MRIQTVEECLNSRIALVLISGEGCANCVSMLPMVLKYENHEEMNVCVMEVQEEMKDFLERFHVSVVPTILLLYNGELVAKVSGYQPEEIFDLYLEAKLNEMNERSL